jgi:tetratricopeptide (TPR) repeat protein
MHRRPRGFILFFGTRPITKDEPGPRITTRCPQCEQMAELIPRSYRQWFTLFFVPVFPIGPKMLFSQCALCSTTFRVPPDQIKSQVDQVDDAHRQRAIGMYNSLRVSPANAVTLNELMSLYAGMNEFDEAISAARTFPAALDASEQCMTTLGRVYLAMGRHAEAVAWFDKAIERNGMCADAQYFKALALSTQPVPDLSAAQTAARHARTAGHPNADLLLRDIENRLREG